MLNKKVLGAFAFFFFLLPLAASDVSDDVAVEQPWVRATVPAQRAGGAFMKLTAVREMRFVGGKTPAAERVEIHEMRMDEEVMRMRPIESLNLPTGETIELKPGGHHLMLLGLAESLDEGDEIEITLHFEDGDGEQVSQFVTIPVRAMTHRTSHVRDEGDAADHEHSH